MPKISVACISCTSCQQIRPISSSRQHRISTQVGMQHHILPIVFTDNIILYFNWIPFVLHVFKRSCNAHITFIFGHFTVYAYRTWKFFCKKNPWIFISRQETISRDEITRLVINTRLITTLKNVDMFKIIEFYWFMHSAFCGWKSFGILITRSLEDGFVHGARFSKWWQIQNVAKCKYWFPSILQE